MKLKGICNNCSNASLFTHRITNELGQELIGVQNYIPLCRTCYINSHTHVKELFSID